MVYKNLKKEGIGLKELKTEWEQTLPEYLRQLRVSSGYKQSLIASKLNISRQTYSHYETGRIRPPARALYNMAKLYEVPVEGMLSRMDAGRYMAANREEKQGYGEIFLEHETAEKCGDELERHLLSCFRKLNEKEKEDLLSIMEAKIKSAG